jgi:hypothetical protein
MKKYTALLLVVTLSLTYGFSQTRSDRKKAKKEKLEANYLKTKALIDSGNYQFIANWANPLGNDVSNVMSGIPGAGAVFQGNRVDLTGNTNFIKISQNTADVIMPYFGRAFSSRINSTTRNGIEFKGQIQDYKVRANNKKQRFDIEFKTKSGTVSSDYQFTVNPGGGTKLTLSTSNRQIITYDGLITALKAKKE